MTKTIPPLLQATAGAVGSASSNALIYPLDFLVTRLQTTSQRRGQKKPSLYASVDRIIRTEGLLAFYRGILPDTISTFLSNFIFFYVSAFLKRLLLSPASPIPRQSKSKSITPSEEMIIGMLSGIVSRFVTTPLGNVTVRKQTAAKVKGGQGGTETPADSAASTPMMTPQASSGALASQGGGGGYWDQGRRLEDGTLGVPGHGQGQGQKGKVGEVGREGLAMEDEDSDEEEDWYEPGILDVVKEIYEEKGVMGLWSGYKAACILTTNPAITFYLIEAFKRAFIPSSQRSKPTTLQTFLTSASASAIASALIYPMILIKTRLQWKSPSGRLVYKSASDVVRKTVRKHGVQGMYQGLQGQLLKAFLNVGLTMVMKQRVEQVVVKAAGRS